MFILLCLGLAEAESQARQITETLRDEGIERTYHVLLPKGFNQTKTAPLVFALHGFGGEGRSFDQITQGALTAAAGQRGIVLVFPERDQ
jgi:polyhydroxybutyrate depolymerase